MTLTMTRRGATVLAGIVLLASTAACAPGLDDEGKPLTIAQSEELASARFRLLSTGPFTATVSSRAGHDIERVEADITVDPSRHIAWGEIARGPRDLAIVDEAGISVDAIALRTDEGAWRAEPLGSGPLASLAVVFSLVNDRPENAQLLRQSDARHLGAAELGSEEAAVYRLPSVDGDGGRSRLWVDDGGRPARLDDGSDDFVIEVTDAEPAPEPPGLAAALGRK